MWWNLGRTIGRGPGACWAWCLLIEALLAGVWPRAISVDSLHSSVYGFNECACSSGTTRAGPAGAEQDGAAREPHVHHHRRPGLRRRGIHRADDVHVVDGWIADAPSPHADRFDGLGCTLLPGLIDAHVHLNDRDQLEALVAVGVTTALDMGAPDVAALRSLQELPGLPTIRSALVQAFAPGAFPMSRMGFPASAAVAGPSDAAAAVEARVADGAAYLKIVVEDPRVSSGATLDVPTIKALTSAAREQGVKSVAHAAQYQAVLNAVDGEVDILTHVPLDRPDRRGVSRRGSSRPASPAFRPSS